MSEIVVLKHGSSVSENANGIGIDQEKVNFHMRNHKRLRDDGFGTVEVASGAVVAGREYVHESGRQIDTYDNRALAKLGTAKQILHWVEAGRLLNIMVSQVLATHSEIDDKSEGKAIIKGAHDDVDLGIIPVFNENNAASEVELEEYDRGESAKQEGQLDAGADNDWLGAHVAISMASSALLLLTNKNGFEIDGKVEEEIRTCDIPEMVKHCNGTSGSGTGGMGSKLRAAGRAADAGIHVVIGNAFTDSRLVLKGEGTRVVQ